MWFRPWMAWAAVVAALFLCVSIQTVRFYAVRAELADAKTQHEEMLRQYAEELAAAQHQARETETALRGEIDSIQADRAKDQENAKIKELSIIQSVRDGTRRLSVVTVPASSSRCPSSNPAASASRRPEPSRTELDGQAAERILGIGIDGDSAIRERNACIDAYNAVRDRINAASEASAQ